MILELKETIQHGTKDYPYDQCYIRHLKHAFQFPVHWHEQLEIIYIEKGTLQVTISEQNYTGQAGSLFLVNPRELHLMGSSDLSVAYYTLLFPLEFISSQSMDVLESQLLQPLRSGQLVFMHEITDGEAKAVLGSLLDEVIAVNTGEHPYRLLATRILLLRFLQKLLEYHAVIQPLTGSGCGIQREMLAFIQKHYMDKITLKELAEHFHMSEKYISRYFKEHFQLTFSSYVTHLRLTQAKRLLETTDHSVTEIALQSGFPNVSYFIRTFKASCGVSPLKYRQNAAD